MKKRATKTGAKKKGAAKAKRAARPGRARATATAKPAARSSGTGSYTPPPLKSDGWPPFRYPLQ